MHPGATCFKLSDRELVAITHILQPAASSMPTLTQTQSHMHEGGGLSPRGTGGGRGGGAAGGGVRGGLVEVALGRVECRWVGGWRMVRGREAELVVFGRVERR